MFFCYLGTFLQIAVRKQDGLQARYQDFPQDALLVVSPPDSQLSTLERPEEIAGHDLIFDGAAEVSVLFFPMNHVVKFLD